MRLGHSVARGTLDGWRALPAAVRGGWRRRVGVGLALCLLLAWALTALGQALDRAGALAWESGLLRRLDAGLVPLSYHGAVWLGAFGSTAMLLPLVGAAAILLALRRHTLAALAVLLSFAGSKPIVLLGWALWERARPDFIAGAVAVPASLASFPSGHVAQVTAVYGLLTWLWTRASRSRAERLLAWTLLVAFVVVNAGARLRLGAHWPSDVVAGAVLGGAWLGVLVWALGAAERAPASASAG